MDFAFSKSPFWTESIRACTISLLFMMLSSTANRATSEQMGLGINGWSLWNTLHFPRLINTLFMKCLYQCNILLGHNTQKITTKESTVPKASGIYHLNRTFVRVQNFPRS